MGNIEEQAKRVNLDLRELDSHDRLTLLMVEERLGAFVEIARKICVTVLAVVSIASAAWIAVTIIAALASVSS